MGMIAIALLLAAGQTGTTAPPDGAAMRAAAARCGLPADWMQIGHDADGDYADPSNAHRDPPLAPETVLCILDWGRENHARIGFLSEPPPGPQPLAALPEARVTDAVMAAERCGLPVQLGPHSEGNYTLLARRHAPPAPLACLRAWLNAHGMAAG